LILKLMEGEKNRKATAKLAVGFHDGKNPHLFFGEAKGIVGFKIAGKQGFGWDRVFIPDGFDKTYAEMEPELKNSISHRGIALSKLKDFLKDNYGI
jgi:XTP/dITP diphosphohydrolase